MHNQQHTAPSTTSAKPSLQVVVNNRKKANSPLIGLNQHTKQSVIRIFCDSELEVNTSKSLAYGAGTTEAKALHVLREYIWELRTYLPPASQLRRAA